LLWLGQIASQCGDSIYRIGLLWLALELSGSEAVTGLVALASYLPSVLLALAAGVAADRSDRRWLMLGMDLARGLLVLALPLAAVTGALTTTFLGWNAFLIAIAATFFNPARDAFIPQLVPPEGLLRANSLIQTSWQFSLLLGPVIAGGLLHYAGQVHLFTANSLFYFASFLLILLIRPGRDVAGYGASPIIRETTGQDDGARPKAIAGIIEGLRYIVREPVIGPLLLITIADNIFIMGPAIVGTPVLVRNDLGLGAEAYALINGCYAVGMLLGTAGLLTWGGRFGAGKVLLVGMVLDGITFVPLYWTNTLLTTGVVIVIHSLAIPMLTVTRASLIQRMVPPEMTGRVFAAVNLAVVGMSAISSGLAGLALEAIGAPALFFGIGIAGGLCGVAGWIWAVKLRDCR